MSAKEPAMQSSLRSGRPISITVPCSQLRGGASFGRSGAVGELSPCSEPSRTSRWPPRPRVAPSTGEEDKELIGVRHFGGVFIFHIFFAGGLEMLVLRSAATPCYAIPICQTHSGALYYSADRRRHPSLGSLSLKSRPCFVTPPDVRLHSVLFHCRAAAVIDED